MYGLDYIKKNYLTIRRRPKEEGGVCPNILDLITNGDIHLIVNSPVGKDSGHDDSYLRKAAIKAKVPYVTTVAAARATAEGIHYIKANAGSQPKSLQDYHSEII